MKKKDEEIIWAEGVNKFPFIITNCFKISLEFAVVGIVIAQIVTMVAGINNGMNGVHEEGMSFLTLWPRTWAIVYGIGLIISLILALLNAKNTYFAITNKRVIKKSGDFNSKFVHYSLNNIGTLSVQGNLLDSKGSEGSAKLIITVKDFHTNTDGNAHPTVLNIPSLNNAYKAYNILSELVDGNNEVLRIKNVD